MHTSFFEGHRARAVLPDVGDAIWVTIKMFLVAEVLILALGMLIALARVSRSPWLAPVRILAVVWTDVVRGVPTLLLSCVVPDEKVVDAADREHFRQGRRRNPAPAHGTRP